MRDSGRPGDDNPSTSVPPDGAAARTVAVAWKRLPGWLDRYEARHPGTGWVVSAKAVEGTSADGSTVSFPVPVAALAEPTIPGLIRHVQRPWTLGIVLVRRGGFAVARVAGDEVVESKVGQRHVQGRSKAGGWSQQRFARRRANQAQAAFDAASGYVRAILVPYADRLDLLVRGGDRRAVDTVFEEPGLELLDTVPDLWLSGLPDPRRGVLENAISRACSVEISIVDTAPPSS